MPEYQTIIESYGDAAEDDIKLTALGEIGTPKAKAALLEILEKKAE